METLNWLLNDLTQRVDEIRSALVLSSDGLPLARSADLSAESAERLSATASAFQSLARGVGQDYGGGAVLQTVIEMESAFFFVTAAGRGACFAVLADADADVGLVAFEMTLMVKRVGPHLSVNPRLNPR
ncbi:putative regulator of Ras-like GTPase activity (Roadblock/LC7/MglB family) [Actinocorallia herbida]|uniref:Putative regulator of Ras-like GTPase activity (Roadblock/LC7/MglB family) n=1 Tax=Actinocorallia herbida TaxID=58109 RepID=A0A3N1D312_9ACTN|nr:roadblock/LC7 domain-containing protein [Actinocorallia herbida]ROO87927.1 putative regulator of Ras-like GTPase activity (Roadblock/LC7/MglB family) [Actinocorallia herbida]